MADIPDEQGNSKDIVVLPIRWRPSEETKTIYANQMIITHGGGEFYLIFGELIPPFRLGPEEVLPKEVEISPVAKIAVTPENMEKFCKAIQSNLEKYHKKNEPEG
jgi:aromatic ring-opening dioxygenase LigB subunit